MRIPRSIQIVGVFILVGFITLFVMRLIVAFCAGFTGSFAAEQGLRANSDTDDIVTIGLMAISFCSVIWATLVGTVIFWLTTRKNSPVTRIWVRR